MFLLFDYSDPLIIAAENGGDGSHCTNTTINATTINVTNSTFESEDGINNNTTVCSGDAHVAQGVAFFLQNFFILLRLVLCILHIHVQLKTTITLLYSTLIFKFGRTEEDPDSF